MSRSKSTVIKNCWTNIDNRIKGSFNRDFFGIYEGIIEKIDLDSNSVNVRIPDLNNTLYEECRIMSPCNTSTSAILPSFKLNTHVIVGFTEFSLANPIILGHINPVTSTYNKFENNTLVLKNGKCSIKITETSIILTNGTVSLEVLPSGFRIASNNNTFNMNTAGIIMHSANDITINATDDVKITGDTVTANGEDVTDDDVGII